jgi:hypothetical protein
MAHVVAREILLDIYKVIGRIFRVLHRPSVALVCWVYGYCPLQRANYYAKIDGPFRQSITF